MNKGTQPVWLKKRNPRYMKGQRDCGGALDYIKPYEEPHDRPGGIGSLPCDRVLDELNLQRPSSHVVVRQFDSGLAVGEDRAYHRGPCALVGSLCDCSCLFCTCLGVSKPCGT